MINHPKYRASQKYYDIMLIELDEKLDFTANIRPACLQTSNDFTDEKLFIAGFGRDSLINRKFLI